MHRARRRRWVLVFILALMFFIVYFIVADISNILTPTPLDPFRGWKGGSWLGYRMGYYGTLLMVASMFYSIVKRLEPRYGKMLGGGRRWLQIHIWLAIIGSLMVLIHAGLPFDFRYYDPFKYIRLAQGGAAGLVGFAGLATLIIPFALVSGFIGRYLYKRAGGGVKRAFGYWHTIHIILTGALYVTGVIHLILVVWFRFVTL
ncbi:MAG: hypothetical protein ACE5KU_02215 [Nitrososphaerales archaeon]